MMKQGIIFDLDGTLWDSSEAVTKSWNEIIKITPDIKDLITVEQMQSQMGKPMEEIAYSLFDTVDKIRAVEILKECIDNENAYILKCGGVLYEGLEDILGRLQKDYFLAIVSNCQEGYIEAFLTYHKLDRYFEDAECYGHTGLQKGENIRMVIERNHISDIIYVGDTMGDYNETMRAASMLQDATSKVRLQFLHAAYGFGKVPDGTPILTDIRKLPEVAEEIFSK